MEIGRRMFLKLISGAILYPFLKRKRFHFLGLHPESREVICSLMYPGKIIHNLKGKLITQSKWAG